MMKCKDLNCILDLLQGKLSKPITLYEHQWGLIGYWLQNKTSSLTQKTPYKHMHLVSENIISV